MVGKSVRMKGNKVGGIVHVLQPEIVQEIISHIGMRWWNAGSSQVAGSVAIAFTELLGAAAVHLAYVL